MGDAELELTLGQILDRAIEATQADFGNIQLLSPKDGSLRIAAQRGFETPFLQFFRVVKNDKTACASAMQNARPIVVREVRQSKMFTESARRELLNAGVRAVQSTPVQSTDGRIVAMISTHFRAPHAPTPPQMARVEALARELSAALHLRERPTPLDVRKTIEELRESRAAKR